MATNKPSKLRASCDRCGVAKVRCDRVHPECGRCVTLGELCVYGTSRKNGKPPRKKVAINVKSANSVLLQKRALDSAEDVQAPDLTSNGLTLTSGFTSYTTGPVEPEFPYYSPPQLDEWPSFEGMGADLETLPFPNQVSSSHIQGDDPTENNPLIEGPHSCPRESYEIFRDLICPGPYLHAPESNSSTVCAQLDFVLHFTRTAIDRLSKLLHCSCSRSGHRVMVHASIISRILIWYQQAAGWTSGNSLTSFSCGSSAGASRTKSTQFPANLRFSESEPRDLPTLEQSTGFTVAQVPLSIGTFSIEDKTVQAAVRRQLVLSELMKMGELIDLFVSGGSSDSEPSDVDLAGLCSHLGTWLRSAHTSTVQTLQNGVWGTNTCKG